MKQLKRGEMRLDDLCIDLTRGIVLAVEVRNVRDALVSLTAGSYRTADGAVSWVALDSRGSVIFYAENAFDLASWLFDSQRVAVDFDHAPFSDTRADEDETARRIDFESSGRLRMYDAFYSFRRSQVAA